MKVAEDPAMGDEVKHKCILDKGKHCTGVIFKITVYE